MRAYCRFLQSSATSNPQPARCPPHFLHQKATPTVTLHLTTFEGQAHGISALSAFRVQQLLPRLQVIHDKITGISARFVHLVASEALPSEELKSRLAALLTYGEPCAQPAAGADDGGLFIVSPRFGTVSPWASKATDIAHNCGLSVKRIERITEYRLTLKSGFFSKAALSDAQREQIAALLHDRTDVMCASSYPGRNARPFLIS